MVRRQTAYPQSSDGAVSSESSMSLQERCQAAVSYRRSSSSSTSSQVSAGPSGAWGGGAPQWDLGHVEVGICPFAGPSRKHPHDPVEPRESVAGLNMTDLVRSNTAKLAPANRTRLPDKTSEWEGVYRPGSVFQNSKRQTVDQPEHQLKHRPTIRAHARQEERDHPGAHTKQCLETIHEQYEDYNNRTDVLDRRKHDIISHEVRPSVNLPRSKIDNLGEPQVWNCPPESSASRSTRSTRSGSSRSFSRSSSCDGRLEDTDSCISTSASSTNPWNHPNPGRKSTMCFQYTSEDDRWKGRRLHEPAQLHPLSPERLPQPSTKMKQKQGKKGKRFSYMTPDQLKLWAGGQMNGALAHHSKPQHYGNFFVWDNGEAEEEARVANTRHRKQTAQRSPIL